VEKISEPPRDSLNFAKNQSIQKHGNRLQNGKQTGAIRLIPKIKPNFRHIEQAFSTKKNA